MMIHMMNIEYMNYIMTKTKISMSVVSKLSYLLNTSSFFSYGNMNNAHSDMVHNRKANRKII